MDATNLERMRTEFGALGDHQREVAQDFMIGLLSMRVGEALWTQCVRESVEAVVKITRGPLPTRSADLGSSAPAAPPAPAAQFVDRKTASTGERES